MNQGAYRVGRSIGEVAPGADPAEADADPAVGFGIGRGDETSAIPGDAEDPAPARTTFAERAMLALFAAAALAWIAAVAAVAIGTVRGGVEPAALIRGIAIASGPLGLLAVLLLLWQRSGPREAARFTDAARAVRTETLALDAVLGLASRRLGEDRAAVAAEADRLMALADGASSKLRDTSSDLSREIAALAARSRELDEAAGTARVDMGVLLADLPLAEAQVRVLGETLRNTGLAAHEQASAFEASLTALAARAKEAEEANAGAANRLGAQAVRIATASEAAARGMGEAQDRMTAGIDGVLARAAHAVERTHAGIVAQGEAIDAMIARAAGGADAAAAHAGEAIGARIAALTAEIEVLGALLVRHDGAGTGTIERIRQGLAAVEARFVELDETGRVRTERLSEALGTLWAHAEKTMAGLNGGGTAATALINRTETLREGMRACLADLDEALPAALGRLDERVAAVVPQIERTVGRMGDAAAAIARAGDAMDERSTAIDTLGHAIADRLAAAHTEAVALDAAVAHAGDQAERLTDGTTPRLVEALVRVRETGAQAADHARDALAAIIPDSTRAIEAAVGDAVGRQVARVTAAGDRAAAQATTAAERIEAGLARIAAAAAAAETRIADGEARLRAADRETLSQRNAQLIEALNSCAIDVARLLGAEPGDGAWGAYLGGDRGIFVRRAVRLLDGADAKAIALRYGEDETFRDRVNGYVHDFEALLRPILSARDGSALAVVLLSSEMGKLYVALAQAIERLRP